MIFPVVELALVRSRETSPPDELNINHSAA
jgi:hypothetical protein